MMTMNKESGLRYTAALFLTEYMKFHDANVID